MGAHMRQNIPMNWDILLFVREESNERRGSGNRDRFPVSE